MEGLRCLVYCWVADFRRRSLPKLGSPTGDDNLGILAMWISGDFQWKSQHTKPLGNVGNHPTPGTWKGNPGAQTPVDYLRAFRA